MNTCYIVGAAPFDEPVRVDGTDLVIAADGGQAALAARGIRAGLVVGDFDSSEPPTDLPFVRHPVEKDDTDMALAVREGMKRGYSVFVFYGCQGGLPDHSLAAVQTLHHLAREGMYGYMVGGGMVGTVVVNRTLAFAPHGRVSVLSLTDESHGVTVRGLKYTLSDAILTNDYPLGVSNEGTGQEAEITVKNGALYVLWESKEV